MLTQTKLAVPPLSSPNAQTLGMVIAHRVGPSSTQTLLHSISMFAIHGLNLSVVNHLSPKGEAALLYLSYP